MPAQLWFGYKGVQLWFVQLWLAGLLTSLKGGCTVDVPLGEQFGNRVRKSFVRGVLCSGEESVRHNPSGKKEVNDAQSYICRSYDCTAYRVQPTTNPSA